MGLFNVFAYWGVEGPFAQEHPGETGKLPWWGVAWYRKHLDIPAADAGRKIFLEVDGAMSFASVWVNGKLASSAARRVPGREKAICALLLYQGERVC